MTRLLLALTLCGFAPLAAAQDDTFDDLPEPEAGEALPEAGADAPPPATGPIEPDDEFEDSDADGPGAEAATEAFRRLSTRLTEATAEERLAGWSGYLEEYPDTPFRDQVEKEMKAAEAELYGEGIETEQAAVRDKRGIPFPEGATLENLNPATRVHVGFDWGIPNWINLIGDVEYAFHPQVSAHFALRKRLTGWSIEAGPRAALLKLDDPGLIVSVAADLHLGVDPALVGVRPLLMVGWRPIDSLYVQVQGGPDFEGISGAWGTRARFGGNVTWRAARPVAMFIEELSEMKYFAWPGGTFQLHLVMFGMRFYPGPKEPKREDAADVLIGGGVPLMFNYWNVHNGSASVQAFSYLE